MLGRLKRAIGPHVQRVAYRFTVSAILSRRKRYFRILMYHGVERKNAESFREQMEFLIREFTVVPLQELLTRQARGLPAQGEIALTFDDGLRNNYTVVYPILHRLGIPATYFICPRLTDNGHWLWTHEVRARLAHVPQPALQDCLKRVRAPGFELDGVVEWMKGMPLAERRRVEETIRECTSTFKASADVHERFDVMTWSDVAALDPALITIGSHSMSHAMLPGLSVAELEWEVEESRQMLERRLNRRIHYFCYPSGRHTPAVLESVRRSYVAAVAAECGVITPKSDPYLLPRIPVAPENPALLAWRMHRPRA